MSGVAYRVLATIAARAGDPGKARVLMNRALATDPRDLQARLWLAEDAKQRGDLATVAGFYDRMLRTQPAFQDTGLAALMALVEDPAGRAALVPRLAARPPWRMGLLERWLASGPSFDAIDALAAALEAQGGLDPQERMRWYLRLVAEGRVQDAYDRWRAALPAQRRASAAQPFNGDFEAVPAPAPFDWWLEPLSGAEARIADLPDAQGKGLKVVFLGRRVEFRHVRQLLRLATGDYRLTWRTRLDRLETAQGLRWVLECATGVPGRSAPFAQSTPVRGVSGWRAQSLDFSVPAACPAQWLVLELAARIPAERQAYGTAWFDDLRIVRRGAADATSDPIAGESPRPN